MVWKGVKLAGLLGGGGDGGGEGGVMEYWGALAVSSGGGEVVAQKRHGIFHVDAKMLVLDAQEVQIIDGCAAWSGIDGVQSKIDGPSSGTSGAIV